MERQNRHLRRGARQEDPMSLPRDSGIIANRSDIIISSGIINGRSASNVFDDNCCGEGVAVNDPVTTLYREGHPVRREGKITTTSNDLYM